MSPPAVERNVPAVYGGCTPITVDREKVVGPGEIVGVSGFKFAATGDTICAEGTQLIELEPPKFPLYCYQHGYRAPQQLTIETNLWRSWRSSHAKIPHLPTVLMPRPVSLSSQEWENYTWILLQPVSLETTRYPAIPEIPVSPTVKPSPAAAWGKGEFEQSMGGKEHYAAVELTVSRIDKTEPELEITAPESVINPYAHTAITEGFSGGCISGPLGGYPIIQIKVEVTGGATRDGCDSTIAFTAATEAAMRDAINKAGAELLEPIMTLEVTTPDEFMGGIIHDLNGRRCEIQEISERGNMKVVHANAPLAEMFGYATVVRGLSTGRASYSMEPSAFAPVPRKKWSEILGYDPE